MQENIMCPEGTEGLLKRNLKILTIWQVTDEFDSITIQRKTKQKKSYKEMIKILGREIKIEK